MAKLSTRRILIDRFYATQSYRGDVLDVGGKKDGKDGAFRPPAEVISWKYMNIDPSVNPDYLGTADHIPCEDNSKDIIILSEVIEHLENPDLVLSEISRVLKQDGLIYASIPFLVSIHKDPTDFQRWTPDRITIEFEKHGFKIERIEHQGGFFAVVTDLFLNSLTGSSKNRKAIKNKLMKGILFPIFQKLSFILDRMYQHKADNITTGFGIIAKKL